MEELYSIMRDFLEVEYNQKSLLYVLGVLEAAYSEQERAEVKLVVNHTKGSLKALQKEIGAAIDKLDNYIAAAAEHK